jgi:hypothetical protein
MIQRNINWNENDSKILRLIAEGVKTKDLPKYIPRWLVKLKNEIKYQKTINT